MAEVKKDEERLKQSNRTAVIQTGYEMTHSAGFEAWLRNQTGDKTKLVCPVCRSETSV